MDREQAELKEALPAHMYGNGIAGHEETGIGRHRDGDYPTHPRLRQLSGSFIALTGRRRSSIGVGTRRSLTPRSRPTHSTFGLCFPCSRFHDATGRTIPWVGAPTGLISVRQRGIPRSLELNINRTEADPQIHVPWRRIDDPWEGKARPCQRTCFSSFSFCFQ